jgi:hypothetical protein
MFVKNRFYPTLAQAFRTCAIVQIVLFGLRKFAAVLLPDRPQAIATAMLFRPIGQAAWQQPR